MSPADKVKGAYFYVADKRPLITFDTAEETLEFQKAVKDAEIYANKTHAFLPTPHGLEFVRGGTGGETAYGMHSRPISLKINNLTYFD